MKTVVTFASTALLLLMISCNCPVKQNVVPVAEEAPVVVFPIMVRTRLYLT